jgi:3-oxoadipyl-CoA thiolase
MFNAYIVDGTRTPIGRYGGALSSVRPDDLLARCIDSLLARYPSIKEGQIEEVIMGCANQAGEDNRNVARMAVLLSQLSVNTPGFTVNRLCGSGLDAVNAGARAIKSGELDLVVAGGVESMSRAPFVFNKSATPFDRNMEVHDTTIGWRFVNKLIKQQYGIESMPETAENVAEDFSISRADQDKFAFRSQSRTQAAIEAGWFAQEITPILIPQRKGEDVVVDQDEHPRATTLEKLSTLKAPFRANGSVTAGNASGVNDGAAALLLASEKALEKYNLTPLARIKGFASSALEPRIMGVGPIEVTKKLLSQHDLKITDIELIELNEAFASQALACLRGLGLSDDADFVNPNGGAIALGHPLGMTGARLALTASRRMKQTDAKYAICTMCVGVGQGVAMLLEKV